MSLTRLCPHCNHTGSTRPAPLDCLRCQGKGYRVEHESQGAESNARTVERRLQCHQCRGTGKSQDFIPLKMCEYCNGTGEQKQGHLQQPCMTCMHTGKIPGPDKWASGVPKTYETCPNCKGAKTVQVLAWVPGNAL